MDTKNQVHGLWIKGGFSAMEKLTIYSFLKRGYQFTLWTYDVPETYRDMKGLIVKDAREIIPEERVFQYKNENQYGHGKGSYAGFSDIFRYKLLYEKGGWWVDMDVTCLKRFELNTPYLFRKNREKGDEIVGNIIYVPQKSELMKICYEEAIENIDSNNKDWTLPLQILNRNIQNLGLEKYVQVISNDDSWRVVYKLLLRNKFPENWHFIHWMNEEFRHLEISKEDYLKGSILGNLYEEFQLGKALDTVILKAKYLFKTNRLYYISRHFKKETIRFGLKQILNID